MNADGALAGGFELLAELEDRLGRVARLVAVEQRLAVLELADRARGRVEAQRQLVAVGAQPREQERIAADVGRHVHRRVGRSLPSASRNTLTPSFKPISAIGTGVSPTEKTIGKWRWARPNSSTVTGIAWVWPICGDFSIGADLHLAVLGDVRGLDRVIEKRQTDVRRGGRHAVILLGSGVSDFASASPAVKLCAWPLLALAALQAGSRPALQFIDCSTHRCEARRSQAGF